MTPATAMSINFLPAVQIPGVVSLPPVAAPSQNPVVSVPASAAPTAPPNLLDIFGKLKCRPDIPNGVYHADRSCVSSTGLKAALVSGAHYMAYLNGSNKETPAKRLGSLFHARVLEPDVYALEYAVAPVGDRREKAYKEFALQNADRIVITPEEAALAENVADSIATHSGADALLRGALIEHTFIWQDEETGVWCKIRPDALNLNVADGICVDLKSTTDVGMDAFKFTIRKYSYDLSAAFYLEGLRVCFGRDFDFGFLPFEKEAPFGRALYGAPENMLLRGRRMFRQALRNIAQWRKTGEYPNLQPDGMFEMIDWPNYWG